MSKPGPGYVADSTGEAKPGKKKKRRNRNIQRKKNKTKVAANEAEKGDAEAADTNAAAAAEPHEEVDAKPQKKSCTYSGHSVYQSI